MQDNILKQAKRVYFVGVGGIGISAVAFMLLKAGKQVSGSDLAPSLVTEKLEEAGAKIDIGQSFDFIPKDTDLVIYTVAITEFDKPFFEKLKQSSIPHLSYPETLNFISQEKYTIAVAGTHGKTTTTAMIAKVLIDNGLDPTVIVGSLLKNSNDQSTSTNFVLGQSKYLVVEADEYRKSFHNLRPTIMVITNIDADHLDFYKDLSDIQNSFLHLAQKIPADGFLICNMKLPNLKPVIEAVKCKVIDYSEIRLTEKLLVPGEHNRADARAALVVGQALGVSLEDGNKSVAKFTGTWRRFEYKGKTASGALVYDDYAHNPQKVKAALQGARELYPHGFIRVVFQPHLFSRTKLLLNDFAGAFDYADEVILAPIFPAREAFDPTISSEILAKEIIKSERKKRGQEGGRTLFHSDENGLSLSDHASSVLTFSDFESIISYLKPTLKKDDVLITMGAGEQYKIGDALLGK